MFKLYVDLICAETLAGRFGPSVISPRQIQEVTCRSAQADMTATIRNVAVWTSARSTIEQGKL